MKEMYEELDCFDDDYFPGHWEGSDFKFLNEFLYQLDAEVHQLIGDEYAYALYVKREVDK